MEVTWPLIVTLDDGGVLANLVHEGPPLGLRTTLPFNELTAAATILTRVTSYFNTSRPPSPLQALQGHGKPS